MPKRSSDRKPSSGRPERERRASRGKPGSLSWLRALMGRPVCLQRRDGKLHVTLVDRRRSPAELEAQALKQLRQELQTRLVDHDVSHVASVMRHLVFVHDELGRRGWAGVAALPSGLLGKALAQAAMLESQESSPLLAEMLNRLQLLKVATQVSEEGRPASPHAAGTQADDVSDVEVSESTHEEFNETERSWVGILPPELVQPNPER
jgi:hypothetical protein